MFSACIMLQSIAYNNREWTIFVIIIRKITHPTPATFKFKQQPTNNQHPTSKLQATSKEKHIIRRGVGRGDVVSGTYIWRGGGSGRKGGRRTYSKAVSSPEDSQ